MYTVIREIHFSYGHRLRDYSGKCRHLHGHNGKVEVEIRSEVLDSTGMVTDFGEMKRKLQGWIDAELDHRMLLRRDDPVIPMIKGLEEPLVLLDQNPTAEYIARLIYEGAKKMGLPVKSVRLWETAYASAVYSEI
jgi:6-pyruvoyltetrahydropterin/6-carboxytetrahydropterin synthase